MTRAIANRLFSVDNAFWEFVYQATVIGLGIVATVAIYLQISGI
jgi:hypothetical protein